MMKRKLLKAMLLCFFVVMTHNLFAQNVVTGTVKDDTGQFLPGVSVVVKGTTTGTITDNDGKFSLSVPNNATLVFSFIGSCSGPFHNNTYTRQKLSGIILYSSCYNILCEKVVGHHNEEAQQHCFKPVSYTHLRAHETRHDLVCRLLLEKKKK